MLLLRVVGEYGCEEGYGNVKARTMDGTRDALLTLRFGAGVSGWGSRRRWGLVLLSGSSGH